MTRRLGGARREIDDMVNRPWSRRRCWFRGDKLVEEEEEEIKAVEEGMVS